MLKYWPFDKLQVDFLEWNLLFNDKRLGERKLQLTGSRERRYQNVTLKCVLCVDLSQKKQIETIDRSHLSRVNLNPLMKED
jgi:hypothetical protein